MTRCVPYHKKTVRRWFATNDPMVLLMSYTQALYQAIGDTKDAASGWANLPRRVLLLGQLRGGKARVRP